MVVAMTTTERPNPSKLVQGLQELTETARSGKEFTAGLRDLGLDLETSDRRALATAMDKLRFDGDSWLLEEGESSAVNFRGKSRHLRHVLFEIVYGELETRTILVQFAGKAGSVNPIHQRVPESGEPARRLHRDYQRGQRKIPVSKRSAPSTTIDMAISERIENARKAKRYSRSFTAKLLGIDYQRYMKIINNQLRNWKAEELVMAVRSLDIDPKFLLSPPKPSKTDPAYGEGKGLVSGSPATRTDYRDRGQWEPEHA
ncbi:HTH DNA binding protein [Rhodococcus phage ChewyVIII]|uniref:HTH DNA binding protein n=1 Tax=Rhodococcus phage ChewyVIII TaxID=1887657 RepID=A0A1C9EI51_9CAUD|nr:HTH DNA binding protein [Rhodococcus phage ChewyVIII]AON97437.1 HTH DNA binding protein [Rhodococcus phage ChewyVIII]